jgi:hypothetical protein
LSLGAQAADQPQAKHPYQHKASKRGASRVARSFGQRESPVRRFPGRGPRGYFAGAAEIRRVRIQSPCFPRIGKRFASLKVRCATRSAILAAFPADGWSRRSYANASHLPWIAMAQVRSRAMPTSRGSPLRSRSNRPRLGEGLTNDGIHNGPRLLQNPRSQQRRFAG